MIVVFAVVCILGEALLLDGKGPGQPILLSLSLCLSLLDIKYHEGQLFVTYPFDAGRHGFVLGGPGHGAPGIDPGDGHDCESKSPLHIDVCGNCNKNIVAVIVKRRKCKL